MERRWLSPEHFEILVEEALAEIPDALWNKIENVAVIVEEWPTSQQLASVGMRSGGLLLGLYEGVPLTARNHYYGLVAPDKITIFRGPILRVCPPIDSDAPLLDKVRAEEAIRTQVRRTVLHEIAHHFGISDERLHELGAY